MPSAAPRSRLAFTLRTLGVVHGTALMLGETLRSWGQGRPLPFVLDDFLVGGGVLLAALWFRPDELRRRAAFAAAWGANAGGLYGSFFSKLFAADDAQFHSNIPGGLLTGLIGLAFGMSVACMIATIAMKPARA